MEENITGRFIVKSNQNGFVLKSLNTLTIKEITSTDVARRKSPDISSWLD